MRYSIFIREVCLETRPCWSGTDIKTAGEDEEGPLLYNRVLDAAVMLKEDVDQTHGLTS